MARVVGLDGLLPVQTLRDELGEAIRAGRLLPGHEMSLRELADYHSVRLETLYTLVRSLRDERLLTVRGDTLIVAPLDIDEAIGVLRLRRKLEEYLIAQSCATVTPVELRQIEERLSRATVNVDSDKFGQNLHEISLHLCTAGASVPERRVLRQVQNATRQCINLGANAIVRATAATGHGDDQQIRAVNMLRDTLDRLRVRDAKAAIRSRGATYEQLVMFAETAVKSHRSSFGDIVEPSSQRLTASRIRTVR